MSGNIRNYQVVPFPTDNPYDRRYRIADPDMGGVPDDAEEIMAAWRKGPPERCR